MTYRDWIHNPPTLGWEKDSGWDIPTEFLSYGRSRQSKGDVPSPYMAYAKMIGERVSE